MVYQMLRGRRLLILLPFAAMILGLAMHGPASAQTYFQELPEGVIEVSVDEGVDQGGSIVVESTTPTFQGRMEPGTTSIELTIRSVERRYTVPVNPVTGEWSFTVPEELELGQHSLFINEQLIGTFLVQTAQVPAPASTGSGGLLFSVERNGTSLLEQLAFAFAAGGLTLGSALLVRRIRRTS